MTRIALIKIFISSILGANYGIYGSKRAGKCGKRPKIDVKKVAFHGLRKLFSSQGIYNPPKPAIIGCGTGPEQGTISVAGKRTVIGTGPARLMATKTRDLAKFLCQQIGV